jgi:hypothetical protein
VIFLPWSIQAREGLPMARQLTPEEIVTLKVLKQRGQSNTPIAHALGVSEGTVRYHVRRQGRPDGRRNKTRKADALAHWIGANNQPADGDDRPRRPGNVHALHDWLCSEHGYQGYSKSVLRFVRARYPKPRLRPFRRVETPPGAQARLNRSWG